MPSLSVSALKKRYGSTEVLHDLELDISGNEFIVFVGPSGCGKSTFLRCIAGLEEVSAGSIALDGHELTRLEPDERNVAMVFQNYALYPHMSVRENMGFGLRMTGHPKSEIRPRVEQAADLLQVTPFLERKPADLSGGQRQRVAIGRAIVRNPKVFLFDEPLSNLDADLRAHMRLEIVRLHRSQGGLSIYVTHDQVEAMTMADRIVVMRDGYIEQVGTPLELYNAPVNMFVAGFLGTPKMNFIETRSEAGGLDVGGVRLEGLFPERTGDNELTAGVRPDCWDVSTDAADARSAMEVKVLHSEQLGRETVIIATRPTGERLSILQTGQADIAEGQPLWIRPDPARLHVFDSDGNAITTKAIS